MTSLASEAIPQRQWRQASFWRGYLPLKELVLLTRPLATLLAGNTTLAEVLRVTQG